MTVVLASLISVALYYSSYSMDRQLHASMVSEDDRVTFGVFYIMRRVPFMHQSCICTVCIFAHQETVNF